MPQAGSAGAREPPPALHHRDADVLDLRGARVPRRRGARLPDLRRRDRGVDARHGVPPAGVVVQRGQEGRARRTSALRRAAVTAADGLAVAGLTPLSTCDWPGQLVATVFLQGCPLACTYCHNPALIDPRVPGTLPWTSVTDLLGRRQGLLDGVVFSGGEPTRQH